MRAKRCLLAVAIPLKSLGLTGNTGERLAYTLRRCDTAKNAVRVCGVFPGQQATEW